MDKQTRAGRADPAVRPAVNRPEAPRAMRPALGLRLVEATGKGAKSEGPVVAGSSDVRYQQLMTALEALRNVDGNDPGD